MQIQERLAGDVTVITVIGDITLNRGGDADLKGRIQGLLQQGRTRLVLDLAGVSFVDSAGLGQLVQVHATTTHQGGALKLINLTRRLRDLFVATKLSTVFESYDDEAAAVASFGAGS
jgi:anti-sigma B factor antagonist